MSSFSVFSPMKPELWAAASPCLHCVDGGGAQFVGRGLAATCCATQIC